MRSINNPIFQTDTLFSPQAEGYSQKWEYPSKHQYNIVIIPHFWLARFDIESPHCQNLTATFE